MNNFETAVVGSLKDIAETLHTIDASLIFVESMLVDIRELLAGTRGQYVNEERW